MGVKWLSYRVLVPADAPWCVSFGALISPDTEWICQPIYGRVLFTQNFGALTYVAH